jgi:hypothetical protein
METKALCDELGRINSSGRADTQSFVAGSEVIAVLHFHLSRHSPAAVGLPTQRRGRSHDTIKLCDPNF